SGVIAYSSADVNGNTLQLDPTSSTTTIARTWDFPEFGSVASLIASTVAQTGYFQEFANGASGQNVFTEPWLTADMPWEPNTTYYAGNTVFSYSSAANTWGEYICTAATNNSTLSPTSGSNPNWTAMSVNANWPPVSVLTPYLYDPATGLYDIAFSWPGGTAATTTRPTLSFANGDAVPNASVEQPEGSSTSTPSPYGTQDAIWNLLPTSDSNGTYYRFATRIVDLNARLNLNTGWLSSGSSPTADPYGEYLSSCPVFSSGTTPVTGNYADYTAGNTFHIYYQASPSIPGRQGNNSSAYSLQNWQSQLWYYEQQGSSAGSLNLFSLGDLLGILSYGEYGCNASSNYNAQLGTTSFYSRPEQLLPNSLQYSAAAPIYGTGYEDLYTTYSWDRNIAPVNTYNGETLKDFSSNALYPRMVDLNAAVGASLTQCASLAGEIEQAAVQCGYTQTEATALAVNYLQYRFNKGSTTSVKIGATTYSFYSVNPTFLTLASQLYLPWIGASSTPWPATADAPTHYYVGQAPQPFLNEFEIQVYNSGTVATPNYYIAGWGIELMNPYAVNLYLKGWGLYVSTGVSTVPTGTIVSDLSSLGTTNTTGMFGYTAASNNCLCEVTYKGANGSITANGANLSNSVAAVSQLNPAAGATAPLAGTTITIYLTRPCPNAPADGIVLAGNVIVDQMSFTMPSLTPAPSSSNYADVQRDNVNQTEWGCDSTAYNIQSGSAADYGNLGVINTIAVGGNANAGMPLYDRLSVGYSATATPFLSAAAYDGNYDLVNWDDFNCISRQTTEVSNADISGPLSGQIGANAKLKFVDNESLSSAFTNEDLQANLYFDFAYDPRASFNAYNMNYSYNAAGNSTGAASATVQPTILSLMTLTDRASDPSISPTPTGIPNSTALVRIPGRININTASEPVLLTAFSNVLDLYGYPNATVGVNKTADLHLAEQMVLDTIAFRQRLASAKTLPLVREAGTVTTTTTVPYNYSNTAVFPGNGGFRSIGDLLVALIPDAIANAPTQPTTLQARDAAWADVANFCTVRSDTFGVYGYIQALQINPNYNSGAVTNVTDWYNANLYNAVGGENTIANTTAPAITTNPTSTQAEFILVGQERFVAVIDRSESNSTGGAVSSAPRVVALQILPQ
ncbi:MAG TPA: hypothetical protein VKJ65_10905, partial [Phycisphaerae bacterium]|nr:hypothetical protein [Phycisphaerae bacterium]